jgi:hypothetical protein
MQEIHATTKNTNQRAIERDQKEEIQDAVKQFVYEAGLRSREYQKEIKFTVKIYYVSSS